MFIKIFWLMFLVALIFCAMKFFSKKLLVLLLIEGCMLCLISLTHFLSFSNQLSFFTMFNFTVFMVLASVFGVALLISSSRSSSELMKVYL